MSEEELQHSLEDLFSDIAPPAADGLGDADMGPPAPGREFSPERLSAAQRELPVESLEPEPEAEEADPSSLERRERWRRPLLRTLSYAALIVGLPLLLAGVYHAVRNGKTMIVPFWVAAYLLLLPVAFWKQIHIDARASLLLGLIYGLGVLDLVRLGRSGSSMVFLLALPILAVTFLGRRVGIVALLVAFLTQLLFSWGISTGQFLPLRQTGVVDQVGFWWSGPLLFLLLGAGLAFVQNRMLLRFADALSRIRRLAGAMADYQARLETQERELKRRALRLEAGIQLGRACAATLDLEQCLRRTVELIPDYFDCYLVSVFLFDETGEKVSLRAATADSGRPLMAMGLSLEVGETSIVGWTAKHREAYAAADVRGDDLYQPHQFLPGTLSEVALPLIANGSLLGVLDVQAREVSAFDETDIRLLQSLSDQIALAILNARRPTDEATLLEGASPLYRASRRLTGATTIDEVADAVVDSVAETTADGCLVVELVRPSEEDVENFRYLNSWGEGQLPELQPGSPRSLSESLLPLDRLGEFWTVADVAEDPRLSESARQTFQMLGVRAVVNIPLQAGAERNGHVMVLYTRPGAPTEGSMRLYEVLSDLAGAALGRAQLLANARRLASRERLVSEATARMHESLDMEEILDAAVRDIGETLGLAALDLRLDVEAMDLEAVGPLRGDGGPPHSQGTVGEEE